MLMVISAFTFLASKTVVVNISCPWSKSCKLS